MELSQMTEVAKVAAQAAAEQIGSRIQEEMRKEHKQLREELSLTVRNEIARYHGDMTPTEHAIAHERIDRFLAWVESISQNFWKNLVGSVVKWGVIIFLLGYFVWNQSGIKEIVERVAG